MAKLTETPQWEAPIYLDNNATTFISERTAEYMGAWLNVGNPSAPYAHDAKRLLQDFRDAIDRYEDLRGEYSLIFTSGASESNCDFLGMVLRAYSFATGFKPHYIVSALEHKSLLSFARSLAAEGLIELTVLQPGEGAWFGHVNPADVSRAMQSNTFLVAIMAANNETGIRNDIAAIGDLCESRGILFHCDAVQIFGRENIWPRANGIASFSASFHKLHGPPGIGLLGIRKRVIENMKLCSYAHICGSQNDGLRGGTENIPAIAGAFSGFLETIAHSGAKWKRYVSTRASFLRRLSETFGVGSIALISDVDSRTRFALVSDASLGAKDIVPWTISVAVIGVCARRLQSALAERGIYIGIGSACHGAGEPSHVIGAMIDAGSIPRSLARGIIRISFGLDFDEEQQKEVAATLRELLPA